MKRYSVLGLLAVLAVGCSNSPTGVTPFAAQATGTHSLASLWDEPKMGSRNNTCNSDAPGMPTANDKGYDAQKGTASVEFGAIGVWNRTGYRFNVRNRNTNWNDSQLTTLSDGAFAPGSYTLTITGFSSGCSDTKPASVNFSVNGPQQAAQVCYTDPRNPVTVTPCKVQG